MIITLNIFSPLNVPSVTLTSSATNFGLRMKPTMIHVKIARIGIITLFEMKSKKSRLLIPSGAIPEQIPCHNDDGIPNTNVKIVTAIQAFFLPQPVLSRRIETIVSIKEIEEVRAAKNTNTKKAVPRNPPIGI